MTNAQRQYRRYRRLGGKKSMRKWAREILNTKPAKNDNEAVALHTTVTTWAASKGLSRKAKSA